MSKSSFFMNAYLKKKDFLRTISFFSIFLIDIMNVVCIQGAMLKKDINYYLKDSEYEFNS